MIKPLLLLMAVTLVTGQSHADEPLLPPHRYTKCSASGAFCVTSDPTEGTFAHRRNESANRFWHIQRWFRVAYLSDDGEHLVTGYDGINLVPADHPEETRVVEFWNLGELLASHTLRELGYELADLQRTVSNFHWGSYGGLDSDGNFRLVMLNEDVIVFDVATGKRLSRN